MLATLLGFAAGTVRSSVSTNSPASTNLPVSAAGAPYRDGLYLGQLDAESGRTAHVSLGRWSSDHNRELFRLGYETGYARASATLQ